MKVHYIGKVAPFLNVTRSNFHNLSWVPYAKRAVPVVTMLKMDCEGASSVRCAVAGSRLCQAHPNVSMAAQLRPLPLQPHACPQHVL